MEQTKLNEEAVNDIAKVFWNTIDDPRLLTSQDMCRKFLKSYLSHPSALRSIIELSVKLLGWGEPDSENYQHSENDLGEYVISPVGTLWEVVFYPAGGGEKIYFEGEGLFDTLEEAKAACQRHHTEQVLKLFNFGGEEVDSREHSNQTK